MMTVLFTSQVDMKELWDMKDRCDGVKKENMHRLKHIHSDRINQTGKKEVSG